jgi:hypothetical protein
MYTFIQTYRISSLNRYSTKLKPLIKIIYLTLAYYMYTLSFSIESFKKTNNEILLESIKEIEKNKKNKFLNLKLIQKFLQKNDILGAYQAFWATWNPITNSITRKIYNIFGGSKNHKLAVITTFIYSAIFLHALHPYILMIYIALLLLKMHFAISWLFFIMTAGYSLLGLPLIFCHKTKKCELVIKIK